MNTSNRQDVDSDDEDLRLGYEIDLIRTIANKWNFKPIFVYVCSLTYTTSTIYPTAANNLLCILQTKRKNWLG